MATFSTELKALKQYYESFEELKDLTPENIENSLKLADRLKEFVRTEALFSKNEELEDLPSETIPFMLVPFYQGSILSKIPDLEKRKFNLEFAESLFDEFLTYLDNYRLTPEDFKEKRKNPAPPTREQKILAFKAKKDLQNSIKVLENSNPEDCRELYVKELELAAIQSLENIDFIKLELQMLAMRDLPVPEPKPYKPPTIVKIDESNVHLMPKVISGVGDLAAIKENMKANVFVNRNAPSMTIEEYGEWALKDMKMREEQQKKFQMEQKEFNSDDEEQVEQKRKKDSEWDNWKDDHEKGAGNRNGR